MSSRDVVGQPINRRAALRRGAQVAGTVAAATFATNTPAMANESGDFILPAEVAGVEVPRSRVTVAAATLAHTASSATLYNHVIRTYLFGSLLLDRRGIHHDRELSFIGCVLHDLGLVPAYRSPSERFELDGADAARRFLRGQRLPEAQIDVVWDAIALHTNTTIAARKRPEIAVVAMGSAVDFSGQNIDQIPQGALSDILETCPRLGFKQDSLDTVLDLCRTKPMAQVMHPFAEVGRRRIPDFAVPTVEDLLFAAPFPE